MNRRGGTVQGRKGTLKGTRTSKILANWRLQKKKSGPELIIFLSETGIINPVNWWPWQDELMTEGTTEGTKQTTVSLLAYIIFWTDNWRHQFGNQTGSKSLLHMVVFRKIFSTKIGDDKDRTFGPKVCGTITMYHTRSRVIAVGRSPSLQVTLPTRVDPDDVLRCQKEGRVRSKGKWGVEDIFRWNARNSPAFCKTQCQDTFNFG